MGAALSHTQPMDLSHDISLHGLLRHTQGQERPVHGHGIGTKTYVVLIIFIIFLFSRRYRLLQPKGAFQVHKNTSKVEPHLPSS